MPLRSPLRVRNPGESDFSDDQSDGDEPFYAQPGTNRFTPSPSTTGNNNLRDLSSSKHFPSPTSDHPRVIKVLATSDGGNKWTTVDLGDARSSQIVKERLFAELNIEPDYQRFYAIHQQQGDLAVGPPLSDKLIVNICQTYGSSTSSLRFAIQPSQVGMQSSPMPTPSSIGALPPSRTPTSANHIQSSSRIIPRLSIDTTRLGTSNQSNSPQGRKLPPIPSKAPSVPPLHTSPTPSPVEHQNQSGGITEPLKLSLNGQSRSGHSGESEYKLSRPSHPHDSVSHDATLEGTKVTRQTKYSNLPNPLAGPLPSTNWSPSPSPDSLVATVNDSSPTLEGKKQNGGPLSRSTRDIPSPALHLAHLQPPTRAARIGAYDEPRRSLPSKSQENLRHTYSRTNDMAPSPTASSPGIGTGGNRSMPNNGTNSNSGSRPSPVSRGPRSRFPPPPPTNADLPIISDLPTPSSSFPNHPHAPLSSSTAMRQAQLVVMEPSMGNGSRRFPATQSRQPSPRYDNPLDIDDRQTENLFDDRLAGSPFSRTSPASPQATTPSGIMSPSQCDKRQPPSPANSQGSTPARPLPKPSPMISASTSVPASPSNLNIPPLGRPPPLPVHQAFISNVKYKQNSDELPLSAMEHFRKKEKQQQQSGPYGGMKGLSVAPDVTSPSLIKGPQPSELESPNIDRSEPSSELNQYDLTGQVNVQDVNPKFKGNYSSVFQGTVNDKLVAVKIIQSKANPSTVRRRILRERTVWTLIKHPNILPFYGFTEGPTIGQLNAPFGALISPWYENGDASKFLEEHGARLSKDDRTFLWKSVIDGVTYLHQHQPAIIHGDLKPGNVIIDDSGCPRICDFGLAQIFYDEADSGMTTTTEHTGTDRYLAPELLTEEAIARPTAASDIYAVGCLGLEFIYLRRPFSHRKNNLRGIIYTDIKKGVPPAVDCDTQSSLVWSMIKSCWDRQPEARPSAFRMTSTLSMTTFIRTTESYE